MSLTLDELDSHLFKCAEITLMNISRRSILSTVAAVSLGGCVGLGTGTDKVSWKTKIQGDYLTEPPYLGDVNVGVATPNGNIQVLEASSGSPAGDSGRIEDRWHASGTPPVLIDDKYFTATDEVILVNQSGEIVWTRSLPNDEYAVINSRPIVSDNSVYITTNGPAIYKIDIESKNINRVGDLYIDGRWWDYDGEKAVIGTGNMETVLVDLESEEVLWEIETNVTPYPCLFESSVVTPIYRNSQLFIVSISAEDKSKQWKTTVPDYEITFTGKLTDDIAVVATRNRDDSEKPGHVFFIDTSDGKITSEFDIPQAINRSGTINDETLYLSSFDGAVFSFNANGGKETQIEIDGSISSPPTVKNDTLLFGTDEAEVWLVDI